MNSYHSPVVDQTSDSGDEIDGPYDGYNPETNYTNSSSRLSSESYTEFSQRKSFDDTMNDENDSMSEHENMGPPEKKWKNSMPTAVYSIESQRMMKKMGFQSDKGLGITGQGRLEPIEAFDQKGRRGLGMHTSQLDQAGDKFDPSMEHVQLLETAEWLTNSDENLDYLSLDDMYAWLMIGEKKKVIHDETKFCKADVLADVLQSKAIFDDKESDDKMKKARARSNPFEMIGQGIFLNRAAMKMANMDARLEFMFTDPKDKDGIPLVREDDLLYFADVCAGPGGFSEYVLWRKGWHAKGFGFTLKNENDFKLDEFLAGHPETFDPHYGVKDDGDVYNPDNIESFTKYVLAQTGTGVHFMMADGGFSVEKQENIQEILCKQLYLCQCLVALSIIRENGHFVVKLFDIFTPFSVGLVYLMYKCFQQICIFKPNTSRPANSERYLVCRWKLANTGVVERFLFQINAAMFANKDSNKEPLEIVADDVMRKDEKFFNYIYESNNSLGSAQVVGLLKIAHYLKHKDLKELRQGNLCTECLMKWRVPHEARKKRTKSQEEMFRSLMGNWLDSKIFLSALEQPLNKHDDLRMVFQNISTWYFCPVATVEPEGKCVRTFFMSQGRLDVLMYTPNNSWDPVQNLSINMTPNTLIYAEIVKELCGEKRMQTTSYGLHIIDGIILGGMDIRKYRLKLRLKLCQKFARALNKPNRMQINNVSISCKQMYPLAEFQQYFNRLSLKQLKDSRERLAQPIRNLFGPERFYIPHGLLFFNELKSNLQIQFSKTHQKNFFFDRHTKTTFFIDKLTNPNDIYASFKTTFIKRCVWPWVLVTQVSETVVDESERSETCLYRTDINQFIEEKMLTDIMLRKFRD